MSYPGHQQDRNEISLAEGQLAVLVAQLEHICRTIYPDGANLEASGHDIRNLAILACTEVEAHWRGVLQQNGISRNRLTTNDYVKTCSAMALSEYALVPCVVDSAGDL